VAPRPAAPGAVRRPACSSFVIHTDDVRNRALLDDVQTIAFQADDGAAPVWSAGSCSSTPRSNRDLGADTVIAQTPAAAARRRLPAGERVRQVRWAGVRGSAPRRRGQPCRSCALALCTAIQCGDPVMSSSRSTACIRTITGSRPLTSPLTSARVLPGTRRCWQGPRPASHRRRDGRRCHLQPCAPAARSAADARSDRQWCQA